jgi:xylulokinase
MNIPEQNIGASYGDAFMAGLGVNVFNDYDVISKWVRMKHVIQPRPEHKQVYDEYFKIYQALYPATKPIMHQISDLKRKIIQ